VPVWEFSVAVVRVIPGGVWGLSGQYGHVTGLHGDAIVEALRRRVPEPERGIRPENRDFPL